MKAFVRGNKIAKLFRALSQPERIRILLTIGENEACVCHLVATLGLRQAYISQHLIVLREAGILTIRRDGRYIFYRLTNPNLLTFLKQAGSLAGMPTSDLQGEMLTLRGRKCSCPHCVDKSGSSESSISYAPVITNSLEVS
jgi:DNA-binding transcriptional ArsR family regulator